MPHAAPSRHGVCHEILNLTPSDDHSLTPSLAPQFLRQPRSGPGPDRAVGESVRAGNTHGVHAMRHSWQGGPYGMPPPHPPPPCMPALVVWRHVWDACRARRVCPHARGEGDVAPQGCHTTRTMMARAMMAAPLVAAGVPCTTPCPTPHMPCAPGGSWCSCSTCAFPPWLLPATTRV